MDPSCPHNPLPALPRALATQTRKASWAPTETFVARPPHLPGSAALLAAGSSATCPQPENPVETLLEVLRVYLTVLTFLFLGTFLSVPFPFSLFTEFWFFSVPYLAQLYLDWDTPFQGPPWCPPTQNDVFKMKAFAPGSWQYQFQVTFKKFTALSPCIFWGHSLFSAKLCGLLPFAKPITTAVGHPMPVPRCPQPSKEQVDHYHMLYMKALEQLFEEHKESCGVPASTHLTCIEPWPYPPPPSSP